MLYWVTMQAPRNEKIAREVIEKLKKISVNGVGWDYEFIFKIEKENWNEVVEIAVKYFLNADVIGESGKV